MTVEPRALAKVELHRHLEGAIRLGTILELSREAGPHFLCEPGGLDWNGAMEAVAEGVSEGVARAGRGGNDVAVGLIAIFSRDYGMESARRTVEFALRNRDRLIGFDIAGSEIGFPPGAYRDVVRPLRDSGLGLTVHSGESGPPEYVREAVLVLQPDRLGHGLSLARDRSVRDLVIERGVALEMCPTSNWLTRGVPSVGKHPIRRLLHEGVKVTLNTDDPGLMGIDLNHEWEVARHEIGFTDNDFRRVTENAIATSFLLPKLKARVRARHFGWLDVDSACA